MRWTQKVKYKHIKLGYTTFRFKINPTRTDYKLRGHYRRESEIVQEQNRIYNPVHYKDKYTKYKLTDDIASI